MNCLGGGIPPAPPVDETLTDSNTKAGPTDTGELALAHHLRQVGVLGLVPEWCEIRIHLHWPTLLHKRDQILVCSI